VDRLQYVSRDAEIFRKIGLNCVRLPVHWDTFEVSSSPSDFVYDETVINQSVQAANIFSRANLYVIFDVHRWHIPTNLSHIQNLKNFLPLGSDYHFAETFLVDTSPTSGREHLARLWLKLSTRLKANPKIVYNILNEPKLSADSALPPETQQKLWRENVMAYVVHKLRNTAGDWHPIAYETMPHSRIDLMTALLKDFNTFYAPHFYSGTKPGWQYDPPLRGHQVTNNDYSFLLSSFQSRVGIFMQNFPFACVHIQEFGALYNNQIGDEKDVWIQNAIKVFKQYPLVGWLYWNWFIQKDGTQANEGTWLQRLQASLSKPNPLLFLSILLLLLSRRLHF